MKLAANIDIKHKNVMLAPVFQNKLNYFYFFIKNNFFGIDYLIICAFLNYIIQNIDYSQTV